MGVMKRIATERDNNATLYGARSDVEIRAMKRYYEWEQQERKRAMTTEAAILHEGDMQAVHNTADEILAKRLNGEDPANDSTTWSRRAAHGMDVFRDTVRDCVRSAEMGHMTPQDALELMNIANTGIQAFIDLDTP